MFKPPPPQKPEPEEEEWNDDSIDDEKAKVMANRFGHFLRLQFSPRDAADLMTAGADWHAADDLLERGASHDVVKRILL